LPHGVCTAGHEDLFKGFSNSRCCLVGIASSFFDGDGGPVNAFIGQCRDDIRREDKREEGGEMHDDVLEGEIVEVKIMDEEAGE
jgi:hypothetical protein